MIKRALYSCSCGYHGDDDFEDKWDQKCSKCGIKQRQYTIRYKQNRNMECDNKGGICYQDSPRWSWAMGVNRQDIPKAMREHPDQTYHPKTGQLLVKNRTEKKRLMSEHGFYD